MPPVNVITPSGTTIAVEETRLPALLDQGFRLETPFEGHEAGVERVAEETYGGLGGSIKAGIEGGLRGLSMGLSDVLLTSGGIVDEEALEQRRHYNPGVAAVTEIAGAVAPAIVSSGASAAGTATSLGARAAKAGATALRASPAGLAQRAARTVAGRVPNRVGATAVEGAIDAGLYSVGQTVSQAVLSDDPLTKEQIAANIGLGTVLGGTVGGAFGLLGVGGRALSARAAGKKEAAKANPLLHARSPEAKQVGERIGLELAEADMVVTAARRAGPITMDTARAGQVMDVAKKALKKDDLDVNLPKLVRQSPEKTFASIQRLDDYSKAVTQVEKAGGVDLAPTLRDDALLMEKLTVGMSPEAKSALDRVRAMRDPDELSQLMGVPADNIPKVSSPPARMLLGAYAMGRMTETQLAQKGLIAAEAAQSTMSRLREAVGQGAKWGLHAAAGRVMTHVLGAPWWSGFALARIVGKVIGGVEDKAAIALTAVSSRAVRKPVTFTAAEILSQVKFGEDNDEPTPARQRIRELYETRANPNGMRAIINERLAPLRAHNLQLGFDVEEQLMNRMAYYAEHAPVPPPPILGVKQTWKPSKAQEYELAVRVRAGENPLTLLDDFASGTLTTVAVETVETLWPELFVAMQTKVIEAMGEMEEVPYKKRLQASIFFKVPVEPTMEPDFLAMVQEGYMMKREQEEQQKAAGVPGGAPAAPPATKGQRLEAR